LWGSGLIFVCIAIGIFVPENGERQQGKTKNSVVQFTKGEEQRVGVDCHQLPSQLADFFHSKILHILKILQQGQISSPLEKGIKNDLDRYDDFVQACSRLYQVSESGKLNGFQDLPFTESFLRDFSLVTTLLRYPEPSKVACNDLCLDSKFELLQNSYARLLKQLQKTENLNDLTQKSVP